MKEEINLVIERIIKQSEVDDVVDRKELFKQLSHSIPMFMMHGFVNTWLASNNVSLDRIVENAFDQPEVDHFKKLLESSGYNFHVFFQSLDESSRGKVIEWIIENYHGISFESIIYRYR